MFGLNHGNLRKRRGAAAGSPTYSVPASHSKIDIEVDPDGRVVAVWYGCLQLHFEVSVVSEQRAASIRSAYAEGGGSRLVRVDIAV